MTIASSGSAGTGAVTLTNEATATLAAIATATASMNRIGTWSYYLDRRLKLVNSILTIEDENLVHFASGGQSDCVIELDGTSRLNIVDSHLRFNISLTSGTFMNMIALSTATNNGIVDWRRSGFWWGTGDARGFMRANFGSNSHTIIDCQFTGITVSSGGRVGGAATIISRNRFYNMPAFTQFGAIAEYNNNEVDASEYAYSWNAGLSDNNTVTGIVGRNLTVATVQMIPSSGGNGKVLRMVSPVSNLGRTAFVSGAVAGNTSAVQWIYRLGSNIKALTGGANLQDVRRCIFNAANTLLENKLNDASGNFTLSEIIHSSTVGSTTTPTSGTTTANGPFLVRYGLYGYLLNERTEDFSQDVTDNLRLVTDATVVSSKSTALAITGISINWATRTVTLTATRSIQQIHDYLTAQFFESAQFSAATYSQLSTLSTTLLLIANLSINGGGVTGTIDLGASRTLDLVTAATYSNVVNVPASGIVTVPDGTTDLSAWAFASGAQVNLRSGATAATVIVGVGQDVGITAGAGVTVEAIRPSTVVRGFPTSANVNGVEPGPVLFVYDASDNSLIAAFDVTDPEYSAGTFTIIPGDYTGLLASGTEITVVGDAVGWRRTTATPIDITNPQTIIDLSFEEYVNEEGIAFMGTASAATGLSYDNANNRIELASSSGGTSSGYKFAEVGYQFDLLTSTKAYGEFDLNLIRQITYISNDTYKRILIPGELKVSANATAETGPVLQDFTLISLDGTDPRVSGLPSDAPSLVERPGVVINYQAPPTTVVLAGGNQVALSEEQETSLIDQIEDLVTIEGRRIRGQV